jgi:hypothetical protein
VFVPTIEPVKNFVPAKLCVAVSTAPFCVVEALARLSLASPEPRSVRT